MKEKIKVGFKFRNGKRLIEIALKLSKMADKAINQRIKKNELTYQDYLEMDINFITSIVGDEITITSKFSELNEKNGKGLILGIASRVVKYDQFIKHFEDGIYQEL